MTENTVLEVLKKYIKGITADELLEKPSENVNSDPELVPPVVEVGYLPPKNFLPEGYDIPAIIVGMDKGQDDGSEASLSIRLTFAVYGAGECNESGKLTPDMKGYIDLIHLMTKVRLSLLANRVIANKTTIQTPIKWSFYDEQPWPYWYGYMTFDASLVAQPMLNIDDIFDAPGFAAQITIPAEGNEE